MCVEGRGSDVCVVCVVGGGGVMCAWCVKYSINNG